MYCISHEGCYFKRHILCAASSILFRLRLLCSAPYDSNLSCFNIKIREPCKFRVCQRNLVFFRFYWLWFKCSVCLLIVALLSILIPIFVNNIRNQHVLWLKICLYSLQSNYKVFSTLYYTVWRIFFRTDVRKKLQRSVQKSEMWETPYKNIKLNR